MSWSWDKTDGTNQTQVVYLQIWPYVIIHHHEMFPVTSPKFTLLGDSPPFSIQSQSEYETTSSHSRFCLIFSRQLQYWLAWIQMKYNLIPGWYRQFADFIIRSFGIWNEELCTANNLFTIYCKFLFSSCISIPFGLHSLLTHVIYLSYPPPIVTLTNSAKRQIKVVDKAV